MRASRYLKSPQMVLYVAALVAAAAGCSSSQAGSASGAQGGGAKDASYTVTVDSAGSFPTLTINGGAGTGNTLAGRRSRGRS